VHSVSYGGVESPLNASVMKRFNGEVQKMGVRGLSVIIASGDDGVANSIARAAPSNCGFNPAYPASCPFVTAVGATQGPENDEPEIACSSDTGGGITSGGGFSNVFRAPDYQTDAIAAWKQNNSKTLPPSTMFSQQGRGYPDVAMMGHNYVVSIGGNLAAESGTSASAPVFASFITLINSFRLQANKKPLGFLNPILYKLAQTNPEVFNDITEGNNKCAAGPPGKQVCCEYGFEATKGWDPVTSLGSVKYAALKKALVALP
jgi:tripeptidyl-peptidase-1